MLEKLDSPGPIGCVCPDQIVVHGLEQLDDSRVRQLDRMRDDNAIGVSVFDTYLHRIQNWTYFRIAETDTAEDGDGGIGRLDRVHRGDYAKL